MSKHCVEEHVFSSYFHSVYTNDTETSEQMMIQWCRETFA